MQWDIEFKTLPHYGSDQDYVHIQSSILNVHNVFNKLE